MFQDSKKKGSQALPLLNASVLTTGAFALQSANFFTSRTFVPEPGKSTSVKNFDPKRNARLTASEKGKSNRHASERKASSSFSVNRTTNVRGNFCMTQ